MRKEDRFTLKTDQGDINVEVYEVRPKDVYNFYKRFRESKKDLPVTEYAALLGTCCNLTPDQLSELYPSEMMLVVNSFKKVNSDFLAPWPTLKKMIEELGLGKWLATVIKESDILAALKTNLSLDWKKIAQDSLKEAMSESGTTGGDTT